jgi:hypothetical protein
MVRSISKEAETFEDSDIITKGFSKEIEQSFNLLDDTFEDIQLNHEES